MWLLFLIDFIVWLQAFNTLVNNALDLITLNSVGDFILFLGKCSVTAATGCIGLIIMKQNSHLHFYAVPTFVVCVFAYFIAHSVLSLYEVRNTFCVLFFLHVVISPFFSHLYFSNLVMGETSGLLQGRAAYLKRKYAVFTQMQDDSNLRQPPKIELVCQGKMY